LQTRKHSLLWIPCFTASCLDPETPKQRLRREGIGIATDAKLLQAPEVLGEGVAVKSKLEQDVEQILRRPQLTPPRMTRRSKALAWKAAQRELGWMVRKQLCTEKSDSEVNCLPCRKLPVALDYLLHPPGELGLMERYVWLPNEARKMGCCTNTRE
jgi:hypothetical protein